MQAQRQRRTTATGLVQVHLASRVTEAATPFHHDVRAFSVSLLSEAAEAAPYLRCKMREVSCQADAGANGNKLAFPPSIRSLLSA